MKRCFSAVLVVLITALGACKSTSTPAPAVTASGDAVNGMLAADNIAITVGRCVRVSGSADCHSIAEEPLVLSPASRFFISCLSERSNGRVIYIGDAAPPAGRWVDISVPEDEAPSIDGTPRQSAIAALYQHQGKFVRGFQYNWGVNDMSLHHICDKIMQDIVLPEVR
ncbi:hypothetical protein [Dongia sp.]|uniref:hypothetical protein n=1 Tax=Dongia sp. TaxID=1977262 RepID=UPI0035B36844